MSVRVQCCAAVIMIVLLYFYRTQRKIGLRTGRAYWRTFCMAFISIAFDIISCVAITNMDSLPKLLVEIACKTYLASLGCLSVFILQYIGADIFTSAKRYHRVMLYYSAFMALGVLIVYMLPISYCVDLEKGQLYSYGPSVIATYVFAAITILGIFFSIFRSRKKINRNRANGVMLGVGCILAAALFQFLNNQFLLIAFAESVCMFILYLRLENPGYNIDSRTGLFNQNALNLYTTQLYESDTKFSLVQIIYEPGSCHSENIDELLAEVVGYLLSVPRILAFKSVGNEITVITEDAENSAQIIEKIRNRFDEGWGRSHDVPINPYWIAVSDPHIVNNPGELVNMLRYVRNNSSELIETHYVEVDSKFAESINEQKRVTELIESALNEDRVEVYYQPIYSVKDGIFTAAEALVRIRDTDGTIIPPDRFVKVAESNGMIMNLGETVFRKVCRFIRDNDLRAIGLHYIEVNLSVIQCSYEHLADDYISIMKQDGISPDMINLEITESASLETKSALLRNMRRLINFGVNFSLDDFGTGQSNLNYIIDMPVEIVKFDREMTNAYFEKRRAKYIMDAAIHMIHGMGLDIVSEGVETEEQLRTLEKLHISYIQGYFFSRPIPAMDFYNFLKEHNNVKASNI